MTMLQSWWAPLVNAITRRLPDMLTDSFTTIQYLSRLWLLIARNPPSLYSLDSTLASNNLAASL